MWAAWASALGSGLARAAPMAAAALACAPAFAEETLAPVEVLALRFSGDRAGARVVVDLDQPLSAKVLDQEGGARRIVLGLPAVGARGGFDGSGRGLVKAWKLQSATPGARLILDLAGDGRVRRRFLIPPGEGVAHYRYVIDLAAGRLPAAPAPVPSPAVDPPIKLAHRSRSAGPPAASAPLVRKVVVIDAGHGGHDPGARSATSNEKDITLAAALALRDRLERTGRYKVVMTRASDVYIGLETRVRIARRAGADLFIALHADSAGSDTGPHGASVYTLSDSGGARVGQVLNRHEWFSRTGAKGDSGVGDILLDLTQRSTRNRSADFAKLVIERLGDKVDLLPRSQRDAGYFVLLAPDVPAVLIEMGFITSPLDELRLTDPVQRGALMDTVAAAIDTYFAGETRLATR